VRLSDCEANFFERNFQKHVQVTGYKENSVYFREATETSIIRNDSPKLDEYIRNYAVMDLRKWDQWVRYATFAHNITPQSSTNYMPFQLLYGWLPNLPDILQRETKSAYYAYENLCQGISR
jgi:hypothetical protein